MAMSNGKGSSDWREERDRVCESAAYSGIDQERLQLTRNDAIQARRAAIQMLLGCDAVLGWETRVERVK